MASIRRPRSKDLGGVGWAKAAASAAFAAGPRPCRRVDGRSAPASSAERPRLRSCARKVSTGSASISSRLAQASEVARLRRGAAQRQVKRRGARRPPLPARRSEASVQPEQRGLIAFLPPAGRAAPGCCDSSCLRGLARAERVHHQLARRAAERPVHEIADELPLRRLLGRRGGVDVRPRALVPPHQTLVGHDLQQLEHGRVAGRPFAARAAPAPRAPCWARAARARAGSRARPVWAGEVSPDSGASWSNLVRRPSFCQRRIS